MVNNRLQLANKCVLYAQSANDMGWKTMAENLKEVADELIDIHEEVKFYRSVLTGISHNSRLGLSWGTEPE